MNLVLIGYRGTGKSTVAKLLAARLAMEVVSLDQEIVNAHGPIPQIVAAHGWPHFRDLEAAITARTARRDGIIIDAGGGVILRQDNVDNLKRNGGFIPGIRPGKNTATYLDYVLTRITVIGALYITLVCVIPEWWIASTGLNMMFLGGTSLLIVVNVTVDTITQIQSHLLAHQYGDLIKKAKLKGRIR